jgi:hypothetical protein
MNSSESLVRQDRGRKEMSLTPMTVVVLSKEGSVFYRSEFESKLDMGVHQRAFHWFVLSYVSTGLATDQSPSKESYQCLQDA